MRGKKITAADKEKILTLISEVGFRQFGACRKNDFEAAAGWSAEAVRQLRYKDACFGARLAEAQEAFRRKIQAKCENALIRRACGFTAEETEEEEEQSEAGRVTRRKRKTRTRYFAPDVGALKFILTNIAPQDWTEGGALSVTLKEEDMRRPLSPQEEAEAEHLIEEKYGFDDCDDGKKTDSGGAARQISSSGGQ